VVAGSTSWLIFTSPGAPRRCSFDVRSGNHRWQTTIYHLKQNGAIRFAAARMCGTLLQHDVYADLLTCVFG
jgi:hypothetical protein